MTEQADPADSSRARAPGEPAAGPSPIVGVGNVVRDQAIISTQTASGAAIVFIPTAHYQLSEAQFNLLVDPPPRSHQWLPTVRGAWIGAVVLGGGPLVGAIVRGNSLTVSSVSDIAWFGFVLTSLAWCALAVYVRYKKDRRKKLIDHIRATWPEPGESIGTSK
jgi:hypothetical protein